MILVSDVFSEVKRVMRACDDASVLDRISDAVEVLCNKTEIDPLIGWVDIVTTGSRKVTLPREVDAVLALNISGSPSFPRNRWAEFHLNGLGSADVAHCERFWDDKGDYALFRDPPEPVRFTAVSPDAADATAELWVYGFDENGQRVFSVVAGVAVDGYRIAVSSSPALPPGPTPRFSRVTAVRKPVTRGRVSLLGTPSAGTASLYGEYDPDETVPAYRRIVLSQDAEWVRVQFRRKVFRVISQSTFIPLNSRHALIMMVKALQKYEDDKLEEGAAYEKKAVEAMLERQIASNPQVGPSFQVSRITKLVPDSNRLL